MMAWLLTIAGCSMARRDTAMALQTTKMVVQEMATTIKAVDISRVRATTVAPSQAGEASHWSGRDDNWPDLQDRYHNHKIDITRSSTASRMDEA